jgi:hypothetical protein
LFFFSNIRACILPQWGKDGENPPEGKTVKIYWLRWGKERGNLQPAPS